MQERDKAALSNPKQGIKFHFPAMKRCMGAIAKHAFADCFLDTVILLL